MSTGPKKHHYNPRYVLGNFSVGEKGKQIWVFDKSNSRSFSCSIANAGSENYFNRFEFRGVSYDFEDLFQVIDSHGAALIRRILKQGTLTRLNEEELLDLALVAAVQLLRTKYSRTSMVEFSQQLAVVSRGMGFSEKQLEELLEFDDKRARVAAFQTLLGADKIADHLADKRIVLLVNRSAMPLWTSDNPVVMNNSFHFGQMGLDAKGIEIYLPIAPSFCLAFFCQSHYIQLEEGFSPSHPRPAVDNPWFRDLFDGMTRCVPVGIDSGLVTYLNELQIAYSDRFVYSPDNDFELAVDYLDARPQHRDGKWRMQLGRPGEGPPKREAAPRGHIVVCHGRQNYFEIRVSHVVEESVAFRFSTNDETKLSAIEDDCPLARVEYYVDGQLLRSIGEAKVERLPVLTSRGEVQARIKYLDESLNRLFKGIDRGA